MKPALVLKKYKKQFLELKYLYAELDYFEDTLKEAHEEFKKAFHERCKEKNINIQNPEIQTHQETCSTDLQLFEEKEEESAEQNHQNYSEPVEPLTEDWTTEQKDEDFTRLYRKIVTITHPDTISAGEREEVKEIRMRQFLEAQEAYKNKNWYIICQLALDLGIELPEPKKQHLKWLEDEATKVKSRISHIKDLFAWVWYNEENNKNNIMDQYISIVVK